MTQEEVLGQDGLIKQLTGRILQRAIENKLHWTLDAAFREDYARNRKDHSAANLAILRKITLNLIRLEPTEKSKRQKFSLGRKRLYAAYNPDFLLKILFDL